MESDKFNPHLFLSASCDAIIDKLLIKHEILNLLQGFI